jgi:hypothetical protein
MNDASFEAALGRLLATPLRPDREQAALMACWSGLRNQKRYGLVFSGNTRLAARS